MPNPDGSFVWYELMTADPVAASDFYAAVVGWTIADSGMPGLRYRLAKVGNRQVGGLMDYPPDIPAPQRRWSLYIFAHDVDAMAARVTQAGGAVHRAPTDIPGVGRFAAVADPQGATFMLFRGDGDPAPDLSAATPGAIGWHELNARDWEDAFGFYSGLFGWTKADAVDMGPMGLYQTFATGDGPANGGMMNGAPASGPFWLSYFTVADIDAAAAHITDLGGEIVNGPHQVPGGSWIVQATDPQGATFALSGPRG